MAADPLTTVPPPDNPAYERLVEELRRSEHRFRSLVETLPNIAVQGYDRDRRVIFWNAASETLYGWTRQEALGRKLEDLIIPAPMRDGVVQAVTDWAERGIPIPAGELVLQHRDGGPVHVYSSHVMLVNSRGEPEMHCVDIDLRPRDVAERAARESEARFRAILEQNVAGIFLLVGGRVRFANRRAERILGLEPGAGMNRDVLDFVAPPEREAVQANIARVLSGEVPATERVLLGLRADGSTIEIGVHTSLAEVNGERGVVGMIEDVSERLRSQQAIQDYVCRLEKSVMTTLQAVSAMVELRDPYTAGHQRRVGDLAAAIGVEMGFSPHAVSGLRLMGYVHDIGKIAVPAELLTRPTRLTHTEFSLIKEHSAGGHAVLKDIEFPWPVAEVILQHHERMDGSGYPRGLAGEQVLMEARIIAVADVVEAITSHRPYRAGLGIDRALEEIALGRGRLFDEAVVDACTALFRDKGYRF